MVSFLIEYKDRYDRREINGSTIRNDVKVVKLIYEMMNDIAIHWKKITRGLANGRQWADDRAPNIDGMRRLCEYSNQDVRIAAFLGSFLLFSAKNQQMNGHIIIWRLYYNALYEAE
jgi:hypothetical protein